MNNYINDEERKILDRLKNALVKSEVYGSCNICEDSYYDFQSYLDKEGDMWQTFLIERNQKNIVRIFTKLEDAINYYYDHDVFYFENNRDDLWRYMLMNDNDSLTENEQKYIKLLENALADDNISKEKYSLCQGYADSAVCLNKLDDNWYLFDRSNIYETKFIKFNSFEIALKSLIYNIAKKTWHKTPDIKSISFMDIEQGFADMDYEEKQNDDFFQKAENICNKVFGNSNNCLSIYEVKMLSRLDYVLKDNGFVESDYALCEEKNFDNCIHLIKEGNKWIIYTVGSDLKNPYIVFDSFKDALKGFISQISDNNELKKYISYNMFNIKKPDEDYYYSYCDNRLLRGYEISLLIKLEKALKKYDIPDDFYTICEGDIEGKENLNKTMYNWEVSCPDSKVTDIRYVHNWFNSLEPAIKEFVQRISSSIDQEKCIIEEVLNIEYQRENTHKIIRLVDNKRNRF